MPLRDLRQCINLLDSRGELARKPIPADPLLEIAAITDRVCKSRDGGTGVLSQTPIGSPFRVATNLFGSERRVCLALGIAHPYRLTERMSELLTRSPIRTRRD